jgi:hypothetical protein
MRWRLALPKSKVVRTIISLRTTSIGKMSGDIITLPEAIKPSGMGILPARLGEGVALFD